MNNIKGPMVWTKKTKNKTDPAKVAGLTICFYVLIHSFTQLFSQFSVNIISTWAAGWLGSKAAWGSPANAALNLPAEPHSLT